MPRERALGVDAAQQAVSASSACRSRRARHGVRLQRQRRGDVASRLRGTREPRRSVADAFSVPCTTRRRGYWTIAAGSRRPSLLYAVTTLPSRRVSSRRRARCARSGWRCCSSRTSSLSAAPARGAPVLRPAVCRRVAARPGAAARDAGMYRLGGVPGSPAAADFSPARCAVNWHPIRR